MRRLLAEHKDRVYTYAFYALGEHDEAEDVTQEVLIKLWRHADRVIPARRNAWVMRVAKNAVIDAVRRRQSKEKVMTTSMPAEQVANLGTVPVVTPDASAEQRELREALEEAVSRLEEPYRGVVVMREIQGLTYQEISDALEVPLNTMKVYLHRARKMLRDALKEQVHDHR